MFKQLDVNGSSICFNNSCCVQESWFDNTNTKPTALFFTPKKAFQPSRACLNNQWNGLFSQLNRGPRCWALTGVWAADRVESTSSLTDDTLPIWKSSDGWLLDSDDVTNTGATALELLIGGTMLNMIDGRLFDSSMNGWISGWKVLLSIDAAGWFGWWNMGWKADCVTAEVEFVEVDGDATWTRTRLIEPHSEQ